MTYLSRSDWVPAVAPPTGDGWCAGTLHAEGLHPDAILRQGVVGSRATVRASMLTTPIDTATLDRVGQIAADHGMTAQIVTERSLLDRIADTHRTLRSGPARWAGQLSDRTGARGLRDCGALIILRGRQESAADRVNTGAALTRMWLALVEAGYAAQPLHGELTGHRATGRIETALGPAGDSQNILAVLRAGRAATPASSPARRPLAELVVRS
jgi:hypothetical protein